MAASAWTSAPAPALGFLSDERLVRLAARGDQRAFSALFERHHPGLTRYCRTILRHAADAEDAAQNGMLAALRALESGTVPMRVKPWLYRIAHNEAITLARTRRPADELDERALPAAADPEEAREVRQRLGQLMSDLQALTRRQREALVLRELCGMHYAEIAEALGSSEAAAQQTVFEARSALLQFGEGRALDCAAVQRAMSDCDGVRLRTRKVRAHVRGCEGCRGFEAALLARRRDLGLLFPPSGAAGGVLAALGRLLGGGGEPLLAGLGLKGAAVGLAVLAGGGAVVATGVHAARDPEPRTAPALPAAATVPAAPAAAGAPTAAGAHRGARAARRAQRNGSSVGRKGRRPRPGRRGSGPSPTPGAGGQALAVATAPAGATTTGSHRPGTSSRDSDYSERTETAAAPAPVPAPVADAVKATGDAVSGATEAVGTVVQQPAGEVSGALEGAAQGARDAVVDAAGTLTGAADAVAPALP